MAVQRAKDLQCVNVDIELFALPCFSQMHPKFDIRKFYADIITFDEDEVSNGLLNLDGTEHRMFELMKRIRQKEFKKRIQGKCNFKISNGTSIALSFFTTVMPARKPGAKKVNQTNNKLLKPTTKFVCQETGVSLYQNQIGTYYPLGGEKVRLGVPEMKKIKNFAPAGMTLMGFKPKSYLKVYHNIKHSQFMHPNEKKTKGASQCSDALIKEMVEQDKIAIVKFIPRENSQVRFCAMLPQEEKCDEEGF